MRVDLILRAYSNTYIQGPLQFSSRCREAIQHMVLSHTENPFSSRWHNTCYKVTSFTLTRRQWTYCLTLKEARKSKQIDIELNIFNLSQRSWFSAKKKFSLFIHNISKSLKGAYLHTKIIPHSLIKGNGALVMMRITKSMCNKYQYLATHYRKQSPYLWIL